MVLHNAVPTALERRRIALVNCGPRAVLTAFSAAEELGLHGWERDTTHVLVPGGTHVLRVSGSPVRVHYTGAWDVAEHHAGRTHRAAPALVLAAGTFAMPRPACGILAAGVQQRLVTVGQLRAVLATRPRIRHREVLRLAVDDISQGAQALSEIDFARLCRRSRLPRLHPPGGTRGTGWPATLPRRGMGASRRSAGRRRSGRSPASGGPALVG